MKSLKIISFDGGGIKGALSIRILKRLCEEYPDLLDNIDLFAGTSTGSLIALALASGLSVNDVDNLYSHEITKTIFSKPRLNLFRPKFNNKNLKSVLLKYFPENLTLKDLPKYVCIPSFNVTGLNSKHWEPVFFNNLTDNKTINYNIIDVALASSAAPTFFPSHKNFIDGGVVANSPTTISVFHCIDAFPNIDFKQNIKLLSIGTGDSPYRITKSTSNWGISQWSFRLFAKMNSPLLSLVMDGMCDLDNMYCNVLLKDNYFRINPKISKLIEMDNYNFVPFLKLLADSIDLADSFKFIETIFLKD
ncbi:patatin-like phospholipase family protein [Clostridium chauvoei]|uniref:Patatin-like phospholipase family protein n=2 Tax=Clostridium chauvoei TaxID=46867 RepID=A0ABD4RF51_9CLOT|nr:patatin-like phospholipase family protein [Clostridium chauvoei]MBX7279985.1 patatin-like phospholipase family protein [Clostridium chauvoei]MBX7282356.1 patatin-like phospholipase family protein [Clostridium chauvoei]MBX7284876.1 patatin-like phospholipase family protein [Clostridium chauvoei]MBX7287268.1 patatin-like phospholipase family protein [Clostridium chauvoei]MBX7290074.1 patatin-like phospholipase family protein [Clostridium chauvoei]